MGPAIFSACATSIAGFSSIGLSHVPGLRDFAILGALGLAGALLAGVTVLPAVLHVLELTRGHGAWHKNRKPSIPGGSKNPTEQSYYRSTELIRGLGSNAVPGGEPRFDSAPVLRAIEKNRSVLISIMTVVFIAALVVLVVGLWRNTWFESDINVMHPQPNPALEAQSQIATAFGFPPTTLLVYMSSPTSQQLMTLAYDADRRIRHSNGGQWRSRLECGSGDVPA